MRILDKYILKSFIGPFLFRYFCLYQYFRRDRYFIPYRSIYYGIRGVLMVGNQGPYFSLAEHCGTYIPDGRTFGIAVGFWPFERYQ